MDLNETAIWNEIQQKNLGAFESYYKMHFKSFLLMARKYLKDSSQAEEIVNDIFLKIWEDNEKLKIETSLKSYIYRAIINRCINALHKNKRESAMALDLDLIPDIGYELQQIEENELRVKLYAAIEQLPEQCRKVFEMSRFEELKQQQIADKLGISIKTVKNHITIALKQLNKSVSGYLLLLFLILEIYFLIN